VLKFFLVFGFVLEMPELTLVEKTHVDGSTVFHIKFYVMFSFSLNRNYCENQNIHM